MTNRRKLPRQFSFWQMGTALPTPNTYRTASGAPGKEYWQNRVDYDIKAEIDDEKQHLTGSEIVTYFNNSPDELRYLWIQLDQNLFAKNSMANQTRTSSFNEKGMPATSMTRSMIDKDYGHKITAVKDPKTGQAFRYRINETMMRIDLNAPIRSGQSVSFQIDWNFNITDFRFAQGARGGAEFFTKDGNFIYEIAQWFPRACVYDDVNGWQHKQFLGQGQFTLTFGNYKVALTVPNDHIVGATGELQNAAQVLTSEQQKRLEQAKSATRPVLIVSQEEAEKAEKGKPTGKKTWVFKADKLGENSNFQQCADLSHQAAGELFGSGSLEQQAVKNGWSGVGITIGGETPEPKGCLEATLRFLGAA